MAVAYDGGVLMGADSRTTYVCYVHIDRSWPINFNKFRELSYQTELLTNYNQSTNAYTV